MLYLHGLGHFFPDTIITNQFIEELDIGSDAQWIMERVGIQTRRTTLSLDYIRDTRNRDPRTACEACTISRAQAGAAASKMAIARANLNASDIGMVVSGSSTANYSIPAEASIIASELDIEVPCFDVNSACSTFVVQLAFLSLMESRSTPPYILVINPENCTHVVDYSDRSSAPLFGDGFTAAVVSTKIPSEKQFQIFDYGSTPSFWQKVCIPSGGHFQQDGRAVQGFAIRKTTDSMKQLQAACNGNENKLRFIGHQANLMMLETVCRRCGIEEENHWYNVRDYGNIGCAGAPSVLSQHWDQLQPNVNVAVVVVGSGLTWAHCLLTISQDLN
jgi:3-oxoacyl-[acyl-carrier-protein] synthase III